VDVNECDPNYNGSMECDLSRTTCRNTAGSYEVWADATSLLPRHPGNLPPLPRPSSSTRFNGMSAEEEMAEDAAFVPFFALTQILASLFRFHPDEMDLMLTAKGQCRWRGRHGGMLQIMALVLFP
jgi:hypothetical protein